MLGGCEGWSCLASPLPPLHPQLSPAAWPRASSRPSRSQGCGGSQASGGTSLQRPTEDDETAQFIRASGARSTQNWTGGTAMSPMLYYALPALGSYVMLSILFLRRPRLLHTPWAPAFRPRLGAHRGGELDGVQGVGGGSY